MLITILYLHELDRGKWNDTKNATDGNLMLPQLHNPIFTPEQCKMIINAGHQCAPEQAKVGGGAKGRYDTKKRVTTISWIPFKKLPQMYKVIENQLSIVNLNHFYV